MRKIIFTINGKKVEAREGERILDVAKRYNIDIPHLCMHPRLERSGSCRLCVVELKGANKIVSSCTTPVAEGMEIQTHTPKVIKSRKTSLQLILANHNRDCLACSQNLHCKLQDYAEEFSIRDIPFEGEIRKGETDETGTGIRRDNSKCILCGRCVQMCNEVQSVYAIGKQNRGFNTKISTAFNVGLGQSSCVNCGQCVLACPTGALTEKSSLPQVIEALNSGKYVVAQTAPSVRASLGECFGLSPGTLVTGKMVSALKEIGFKKVFDTTLAADLTIVEEATELIERIKSGKNLPLITTCCPAWVKFAEQFYPEKLNHLSSCKSPQSMMAALIKSYFAEKMKIPREEIVVVNIMPCTAKKYETVRPEFNNDSDYTLTTVELSRLIENYNIDFKNLPESQFDNPLGESTGAGTIFGQSGGVMEAALRTAADWISKKDLKALEYNSVRGMETLREATVKVGNQEINVAVAHTLSEARKLMDQIREGSCKYQFIEVMACYGGCIGGGGQPRTSDDPSILQKRRDALFKADKGKKIRKSHKNPTIAKIYKEYLGEYGSKKAHKLLHTAYTPREVI